MTGFRDDIVEWAAKVGERLDQIPAESAKLLIDDVRTPVANGGHMPVRTGNLRNSAEVSFNGPPLADQEYPDEPVVPNPEGTIQAKLDSAKTGDLISIGFRAIYGPAMEVKYAFVRLAAQKWPQHVNEAVKNVLARTR